MTPFRALARTLFRVNFDWRRLLGVGRSASKWTRILIAGVLLYVVVGYGAGLGFLFDDLGRTLAAAGFADVLLMYLYLYGAGIAAVIVFFRADAMLYRTADFELLGSMPIRPLTLLGAKALILMTNIYATVLFVTAPIAVAYFRHGTFTTAGAVLFPFALLALPLVPAVLTALVALAVRLLTDRLPRSRTVNTVLMFALVIGAVGWSFAGSLDPDANPLLNQRGFIEGLGAIFPPMGWFADTVANGDPVAFVLLVGTGVFAAGGFLLAMARLIQKTNAKARNERFAARRKNVDYRSASAFRALVGKEWRVFLGTTIYVTNTGVGLVFLIVAGIASLFFADKVAALFTAMTEGTTLPIHFAILGFASFCVSMTITSAISLSLEGKRFWILKSMPIRPATVIDAKLAFNVLLGGGAALVGIPLLAIGFALPVLDALAILVAVLSLAALTSVVGSHINLRFPKFAFKHEVEVVKQSLASLVAVFGGFGIAVAGGFALFGLTRLMPWQPALFLIAALYAAAAWFLRLSALRVAENLFIRLGV